MKKRTAIISVLLAVSILCTGCFSGKTPEDAGEPAGGRLVDCAGRTVELPRERERIACLYAYTGHVAVLLQCEENIVAVVDGLKRDSLMREKVPGINELSTPYSSGAINIEELAAARPDLIFLRASNLQDEGELEKLDGLSVPYVVVEYITMEDQKESIRVMGQALDKQEEAEAYLSYYDRTIAMVRERLSALPEEKRKTVYHSVNEAVRTDIPDTLSYQVLEAAGCRNVVTGDEELRLDGEKGYASVEQIYLWDPDLILTNEPAAWEYFRTDAKFSGLRAVREDAVFQLPVGLSRWAHPGSLESPLAVLYIASTLYPEYFSEIDMSEEIRDFYKTFFRIELTDGEIDMILKGEGMRDPRKDET